MADRDHLMNLMKKIATEQNFKSPEIQITPISTGGANYSSKLYLVTVSERGKDDLKLFVKAAVISEKMRGATPLKPFDNEYFVYSKLMETYRRLEDKHGVSDEDTLKFPKFYGIDMTYLQEIIVLEDLTSSGFESANRFESVDWPYAAAAVTELAKLHALSMAYQHEFPSEFEKTLETLPSGLFSEDDKTNQLFIKSAKMAVETVREENKERLKSFLDGKSLTTFSNSYRAIRRQVLIHVDFRPSNMLHRVKDDGTTEVIAVDYQTVQGGCPVADLLYFIFTATDGQFRAKYYQKLVDHYHAELGAALSRLELNVENEYSRSDFELELKERLPYGLLVSVLLLPILTVLEDHAPSLEAEMDMNDFAIQTTGVQYPDRLNEAVDDYIAWGVL